MISKKLFKQVADFWKHLTKEDKPYWYLLAALCTIACMVVVYRVPVILLLLVALLGLDIYMFEQKKVAQEKFLQSAILGVSECIFELVHRRFNMLKIVQPWYASSLVNLDLPFMYKEGIPFVCIRLEKQSDYVVGEVDIVGILNRGIAACAREGNIVGFPRAMVGNAPVFKIVGLQEREHDFVCLYVALLDYPGTIEFLERHKPPTQQHPHPHPHKSPPTTREFG